MLLLHQQTAAAKGACLHDEACVKSHEYVGDVKGGCTNSQAVEARGLLCHYRVVHCLACTGAMLCCQAATQHDMQAARHVTLPALTAHDVDVYVKEVQACGPPVPSINRASTPKIN